MTKIRLSRFSRDGHADRAHRLGLVHLAVAHEGPDLAAFGLDDVAVLQILHETRLVDRHQRAQAHGYRRELPEVGHQPGVRIGGNAVAVDFLPVVVHLLFGQAAEHEGPRVDPGCRVALDEHQIATAFRRVRAPEMVEADVVEHGGRREARDVAADVGVLVGAQHHRHRVPAHVGADPVLDGQVARNAHLRRGRNGVDVAGGGRERQVGAALSRRVDHLLDQEVRAIGTLDGENRGQRIQPLAGFLRIGVVSHCIHGESPKAPPLARRLARGRPKWLEAWSVKTKERSFERGSPAAHPRRPRRRRRT